MGDVGQVAQFEKTKLEILGLFESNLHTYVLENNVRDMVLLVRKIRAWVGTEEPASGILETIGDELRYCSAAQRALLLKQEKLFVSLARELESVGAQGAGMDHGRLTHSVGIAKVHALLEQIVANIHEILAVPGARRRSA